ncbi:tau 95 subunit of transcription factor TFIIIC [Marasmius crinis-equi]|uniref:Tau 95 subunit of transcription factor TFIIIC n=1 Tax=Marasmius crinis-equi TaxID=585013 RepID=A0ABR3G2P7_9AGAR
MSFSRRLAQTIFSPRLSLQLYNRNTSRLISRHARPFSISTPRQASEQPDLQELYVKLSQTTVYKKLQEAPAAFEALKNFGEIMKNAGFDPTQPPSTMQMLKLSMNKEVREAGLRMNEEFAKAGIDLTDKDLHIGTRTSYQMDFQPVASTSTSTFHFPPPDTTSDPQAAPQIPVPSTAFYSVEYPGYVRPESVPVAIQNLGGPSSLESAFRRGASKAETLVELKLRPENPFAHPVPGEVVTNNCVVLKVTKRKRKRRESEDDQPMGEYKVEPVGVLGKTMRFRSMVDYQYQPEVDDPLTELRHAMEKVDVDKLCSYTIPPEREDYLVQSEALPPTTPIDQDFAMNLDPQLMAEQAQTSATHNSIAQPTLKSNLRLFPPPLLSRQNIPQGYNYKANPASMVSTTVDEETGEEKKRLINRMRWKGYGPAAIAFHDPTVPSKPPQNVEEARNQVDGEIVKKIEVLFKDRPIWTRMSLFNQLTPSMAREIHNSKIILPLVCYVFQDGPWRDTLVRFSYDPRKDPEARFYQRLYFRNANHPINRPSVMTRRQERSAGNTLDLTDSDERRTSHIFDGQTLTKETAAFQLCDITDPMLKEMIESPEDLRETCDERDGWYSTYTFERIKLVLRLKFFSLLEGRTVTDEECQAALEAAENSNGKSGITTVAKHRVGKHNMAKGALRPEDAAAFRLRATLEREKKISR